MASESMSDERLAEIETVLMQQHGYVAGMRRPPHELDVLAALEELLADNERLRALEARHRALAQKVSEHRLSVGWGFKRTCPFCLTETEEHEPDCAVMEARALLASKEAE